MKISVFVAYIIVYTYTFAGRLNFESSHCGGCFPINLSTFYYFSQLKLILNPFNKCPNVARSREFFGYGEKKIEGGGNID